MKVNLRLQDPFKTKYRKWGKLNGTKCFLNKDAKGETRRGAPPTDLHKLHTKSSVWPQHLYSQALEYVNKLSF